MTTDNVTHSHTSDQQSAPRQNYGRGVDLTETRRFLKLLGAKNCTFQTCDDEPDRKLANGKLAKLMHGDLARHTDTLKQLNRQGAGIFMAMNETDLAGRKKENIKRIRAVVLDLDGEPLAPVHQCPLKPHVIVETSPGHYHVYWKVKGFPKEQYEDVQRGLAKRFDGDPAVALLTFCARLPGFSHCKREAFNVRIVESSEHKPYTFDEISKEFPPTKKPHKPPKSLQGRVVLFNDAPVKTAEEFVKRFIPEGAKLQPPAFCFHCHRDEFYRWNGSHFVPMSEDAIRHQLFEFLDNAITIKKDQFAPFNATPHKVNAVIDTLKSVVFLDDKKDAPFWLGRPPDAMPNWVTPDPTKLIACQNGLLDIETRSLTAHTPYLFNVNCLPFDYDAKAPLPKQWLEFLQQLWPDDKVAKWTLRRMFGLLLTSDTSYQKIFVIIGPKRSGKGTIGRILRALLGAENVTNPTMGSLSGDFGIWPLIDKRAAIISDARIGKKTDAQVIAERLLSISGEDGVQANRKNQSFWNGRLAVRFVILTNKPPKIDDASGALVGRYVLLTLQNSFYGKEDRTLTDKLLTELPGILNWSLRGLDSLREKGHFPMPDSSRDMIRTLEDAASPVGAFVRDWCEVGGEYRIVVKLGYNAYRAWCAEQGDKQPGTSNQFGVALREVLPHIQARGRGKERFYDGIKLSTYGDERYDQSLKTEKS